MTHMNSITTASTSTMGDSNISTFGQLDLHPSILKALDKTGYSTPTAIQAQAIPHALDGRDLLLSAQTGSGKTASFVLPILDRLAHNKSIKHLSTLILVPTRELAQQVYDSVRTYGHALHHVYSVALVGGVPYGGQIRALRKGVQIIIATPGRFIDHMNAGRIDLSNLSTLILDEADRMLDMGFSDDINAILHNTPISRQTIMSSATWDGAVGQIAQSFTTNPVKVAIKVESAHIDESVYYCDDFYHKNKLLLSLLTTGDIKQAVVFTATKRSTEQLAQTLTNAGLSARYLHGDLPQGKRNRIIKDVKSGGCHFLIATDVAARGIDISSISHVINYDLPRQVEDYVHRIGRCGRAGRTGVALNLCSRDDYRQLMYINHYLKREMKAQVVPGLEPAFTPVTKHDKDGKKNHPKRKSMGKNTLKNHSGKRASLKSTQNLDNRYDRHASIYNNSDSNEFKKSAHKQNSADKPLKSTRTKYPHHRTPAGDTQTQPNQWMRQIKHQSAKAQNTRQGATKTDKTKPRLAHYTHPKTNKGRSVDEIVFKSRKFGEA